MYKGTTPTYTFTFDDFDPTTVEEVILTIAKQNGTVLLEKTSEDLEITSDSISVYLSQEETLYFPGVIQMQINFLFSDDTRCATDIVTKTWEKNLHDEVMT